MSLRTVYDERFDGHVDPGGHPENPARLRAVVRALRDAGLWERLAPGPAVAAEASVLGRVHGADYLRYLRQELGGEGGFLNADTYYARGSVAAAELAAGAAWELTRDVLAGRASAGLALVRPPGHHAEARRGKGFCLLNNIAVAAAGARQQGARVAIVDFDVHHGDGTQQAFWRDGGCLYVSSHRHGAGFYPGSGAASERGEGPGEGTTLNLPLAAGATGADLLHLYDREVGPAIARFAPDVLLVSAGFDAHASDPLSDTVVDDASFDELMARLCEWADLRCQGRMVAVLEGGYDRRALSAGVCALARRMLGERSPERKER